MGLKDFFSNLNGPVFIKEDNDAEKQLEYLQSLPSTPEIEKGSTSHRERSLRIHSANHLGRKDSEKIQFIWIVGE